MTKEQEKLRKESDLLQEVEMYKDEEGVYRFRKIEQFIEKVKGKDLGSLNTDTGTTNTFIIFTDPLQIKHDSLIQTQLFQVVLM